MEHIIECNNLTHYYGKRLIYENLSFTTEDAEDAESHGVFSF